MGRVDGFLKNAAAILATAEAAPRDGQSPDVAILVGADGALRVVDGAGWHPEALQAHYAVREVYQVTRTPGGVKLRARSGGRSCELTSESPAPAARFVPHYTVLNAPCQLTAAAQ
jgi:hypothetical protein